MTSTSRAVHHGWKQNRREHHNDDGGNNDVHWSCGAAPYLNIGMSGSQSGSLPFSPTQSQVPPNKISTKAEQNLVLREQGTCYCGSAYYGVPSRFASKHKRQDYHFLFFFFPFPPLSFSSPTSGSFMGLHPCLFRQAYNFDSRRHLGDLEAMA